MVQDYNGLRQLFLQHGTVKNVTVPFNPMNAIPRGFAFVTLSSAEEAEKGTRPPMLIALLGRTLTPHLPWSVGLAMAWPESVVARDALHDKEFRGSHIRISFGNPAKAHIATGPISPRFNPPAAHRGQPYARGGLYPPPSLPVRTPQGSAISHAQPGACLLTPRPSADARCLPVSWAGRKGRVLSGDAKRVGQR